MERSRTVQPVGSMSARGLSTSGVAILPRRLIRRHTMGDELAAWIFFGGIALIGIGLVLAVIGVQW